MSKITRESWEFKRKQTKEKLLGLQKRKFDYTEKWRYGVPLSFSKKVKNVWCRTMVGTVTDPEDYHG